MCMCACMLCVCMYSVVLLFLYPKISRGRRGAGGENGKKCPFSLSWQLPCRRHAVWGGEELDTRRISGEKPQ